MSHVSGLRGMVVAVDVEVVGGGGSGWGGGVLYSEGVQLPSPGGTGLYTCEIPQTSVQYN